MSSLRKEPLHPGRNFDLADKTMIKNWKEKNEDIWDQPEMRLNRRQISRSVHICVDPGHAYFTLYDNQDPSKVRKYEVILTKENKYFVREHKDCFDDDTPDIETYLEKNHGLKITTTRLNDNQLDKLALWCNPNSYSWIRGDCMAFAKAMAYEIACKENGMDETTWKELTQNLAVIIDDETAQSSELKSRRYPNYPKGYFMAFTGDAIFKLLQFSFTHAMIGLGIVVVTGACVCYKYIL